MKAGEPQPPLIGEQQVALRREPLQRGPLQHRRAAIGGGGRGSKQRSGQRRASPRRALFAARQLPRLSRLC